jgi:hypothetical protein
MYWDGQAWADIPTPDIPATPKADIRRWYSGNKVKAYGDAIAGSNVGQRAAAKILLKESVENPPRRPLHPTKS